MSAPVEIIERIKKLLRLARSSNQHEAQLALQRAMALAAEYRVAIDALNPDASAPSVTHQDTETLSRLSYDRKFAALIVQRFFRVKPIARYGTCVVNGLNRAGEKLSFVGTASDIEISLYVYHFLVRHFSFCWRNHRARCRNRYSFVEGMFQGIYTKLLEAEPAAGEPDRKGTELVVSMKGYIDRHIGKTESKEMASGTADAARYAGYVQGRNTQICPAIKTRATVLALE